ncbi:MAG: TldD/PmbA family protein [Clostridia bacterium]|nr:TldD/PmbA family protein [Clostridia bacterium]
MLNDSFARCKSLFADNADTVLRAQENRLRRVVLQKGNLVSNVRMNSRGVNARVTIEGVAGLSSLAECTPEAAETVLKAATRDAMFLHNHAPKNKPMLPSPCAGLILPEGAIVDTEQQRCIDLCRAVDEYVVKSCPKLVSRTVVYTEDSMDKIIYTSHACDGHVVYPRSYVYVMMTAEAQDGAPVELFQAFGGAGSFNDHFECLDDIKKGVDDLYEKVLQKCEGVYAEAGAHTVVLGGMMAGMLAHEAVGHTVEADLVMGGSVAGLMLEKRVGSELVNLTDFANTAFGSSKGLLPVYMDDEGVRAEDAVLIENGILKGYMNSRETAERYGVKPCGNARGWTFSDEPLIRMRNTAVHPGKNTLEELIASVDNGYYLIESGNGQADLTGEFMFGVTMGYEIKNGRLGKALKDTTVSGIAFEMLKTVDMISSEMTWSSSGFCGKKQPMAVGMGGPAMRCRINIGGR